MIYDMAKVTVTLYIDEEDKEALQQLADAEERSLSQMAVLILKKAIRQAQDDGKILPNQSKWDEWGDRIQQLQQQIEAWQVLLEKLAGNEWAIAPLVVFIRLPIVLKSLQYPVRRGEFARFQWSHQKINKKSDAYQIP